MSNFPEDQSPRLDADSQLGRAEIPLDIYERLLKTRTLSNEEDNGDTIIADQNQVSLDGKRSCHFYNGVLFFGYLRQLKKLIVSAQNYIFDGHVR